MNYPTPTEPQVVLFENHQKRNEKAPDVTGKITFPDGKVLDVAAWRKVSKTGAPYLSGKLSEPFDRGAVPQRTARAPDPAPRSREVKVDF